jgi:uncharacterized protein (DUF427 family)
MAGNAITESVWDYPRPPRVEPVSAHISVVHNGETLVSTNKAVRVLETSHPPTYYLPIVDFADGVLVAVSGNSFCEFKGLASYFDMRDCRASGLAVARGPTRTRRAASRSLAGKVALYASRVDECRVGDEIVTPQEGDFYGGWITSNIEGPFKGAPGTMGW